MDMMDPSSAQEMSSQTLESMLGCTTKAAQQEKKPRPADQQALNCPRCDSTNTKFCYYNNYSLSQPRYFCKSCRRYWTKGGTLRNVPVGGGCRKNKRSSSSSKSRSQDQSLCSSPNPNLLPSLNYEASDSLSLALARLQKQANLGGVEEQQQQQQQNNISSMMCNPQNTPYDILGNHHGFLETATPTTNTNLFQNLYYNNMGGGGHHVGEMGISYQDHQHHHLGGGVATSASAVKQEMCNSGRDNNNNQGGENSRVFWSFPVQQMGGVDQSNNNMGEQIEYSSRQNWRGFGQSSPSWHGLLNSPLM